jgi:glucosamine--fructose-6-phosphate aminotransferase (isomerizing)
LPTSLALQSALAAHFIQDYWHQARELASQVLISEFNQIVLCGCGDSHHAAYALSYTFSDWTGHAVQGLHAMEAARYAIPRSVDEDLLVIGISFSGETARTIEAIRLAQDAGAQTLAVTADPDSTLAKLANSVFILNLPEHPAGPGLISYLAALMAGYAIGAHSVETRLQEQIDSFMIGLPEALSDWVESETEIGQRAAQATDPSLPILFLGSGPVRGAAMFAAAKVIEASGQSASSQDVEEWAHLEYFSDPARLPVWLLSVGGRTIGRELEIEEAAAQLGRQFVVSKWRYGSESLREILSPLALWAGPVAYADSLMNRLGESPFRGFVGGRDRAEGGGISRIRSSAQLHSLKDLSNTNPPN